MFADRQGNSLSGATADAVALFDQAVEAFNLYRGDPLAMLDSAVESASDFAMAHILKAQILCLATEPAATSEARTSAERLKRIPLTEREGSHLTSLEHLLSGRWTDAALTLDYHTMRFPHDLVALQCGHLTDFYRANARDMRDRLARVLPRWSEDVPGYPIVLGMYAFGLEESGNYALAEEMGRRAVDLEPRDCWAHHAVAHVMEMQGRSEDGIGWMIAREPYWSGEDNFFKVHNWWHRALYHLDLGQVDQVLSIYDGAIRQDYSTVALDCIDASALLWRLHLCGQDVGERWHELAQTWNQHADGSLYPFNDWHASMAYLGAGRTEEIERILSSYRTNVSDPAESAIWGREIGVPLIEGFSAFWYGDYETAAERLHRARFIVNRFGGSHAQRDIIDWTLTEAALRGKRADLAQAMAHERLGLRPHSPVNRRFLARAHCFDAADCTS